MTDFAEVLHEIQHGAPLDLSKEEERVNPDETRDDDAPDQSEDEKGKLDGEPESDSKDGQVKQDKDKDSSKEPESPAPDQSKSEETKDDDDAVAEKDAEPTIEIDGETFTLSQVRDWRESGLRLEDYTKKTMELSTTRRTFLEEQRSRQNLARDISEDVGIQQFLAARPEALANLMQDPESTRKLIGNPRGVKDFWADFDAIKKSPTLAKRMLEKEGDESAIDAELRKAQEVGQMETIIGTLEQFVGGASQGELYKHLGDEAAHEVLEYIAGLAGVPENPTHEQQMQGVGKLFNLFFVQQNGEWGIDHRLIQGEFERIKNSRADAKDDDDGPKDKEIDAHNKAVDAQLKDNKRPPKTPDGQPPAAEQETPDIPDSFHGILRALNG